MDTPFQHFPESLVAQKQAETERAEDLKACLTLVKSEAGGRVLKMLRRLCDFDGPVARRGGDGKIDHDLMLLMDGWRGCISTIEKNAELARNLSRGKR